MVSQALLRWSAVLPETARPWTQPGSGTGQPQNTGVSTIAKIVKICVATDMLPFPKFLILSEGRITKRGKGRRLRQPELIG